MGITDLFSRIADENKAKAATDLAAQRAAEVASPVYTVLAMMNRLLRETGIIPRARLSIPVLSIGNLTMGGTGKTPACVWLAGFLRREGRRPVVLTRGYGRADEKRLTVVHDGTTLVASTRDAGDEPVLLARSLGDVPVIACASRHEAGLYAIRKLRADVAVLDDGFQHHALERNADLVLVDATRPLSRLRLFPRGTLREPLSTLKRAHLLIITRWNQATLPKRMLNDVRRAAPHVPIVRTRMAVTGAARVATREALSLETLKGRSVVLLSGIGNPASFRKTAEELGLRVLASKILKDHARITKPMLLKCDSLRRKLGADLLLVTEKDGVKILELGSVPPEVVALRVRLEFLTPREEETAERIIRARMNAGPVRALLG